MIGIEKMTAKFLEAMSPESVFANCNQPFFFIVALAVIEGYYTTHSIRKPQCSGFKLPNYQTTIINLLHLLTFENSCKGLENLQTTMNSLELQQKVRAHRAEVNEYIHCIVTVLTPPTL